VTEFSSVLDFYSLEGWASCQFLIPASEWGQKETARAYLDKYWLARAEYDRLWKPIQDQIFINQAVGLPEMLFAPGLQLAVGIGVGLWIEPDFGEFQKAILAAGSKHLIVVENTFGGLVEEPPLRMIYPASITWAELTSGNFVSGVLLGMTPKEYFIFGDTPAWGRYAASDYFPSLEIDGFRPEVAEPFLDLRRQTEFGGTDIRQIIPLAYRGAVNVPDFERDPIAISATLAAGGVPTLKRMFENDPSLAAAVRVYQGSTAPLATVTVRVHLRDKDGRTAFEHSETLAEVLFAPHRSADYQVSLPRALRDGNYLLTISAMVQSGPRTQYSTLFTVNPIWPF